MEGHMDHSGSAPSACPSTGTIIWWHLSVLRYEVLDCSTLKVISIEMTGDFYWLTNVPPQAVFESFIYELELSNKWRKHQQQRLVENYCDQISDSLFRRHVFFLQLAPPSSSAVDIWHILWHIYKWNTENQMFAQDKREPQNKLIQFQLNRFPLQWMNSFLQ